ncbi:MAG: hypothetical protein ACJ8EF_15760 [Bradyrhizobium sp.]|jgi:hypothetical protein
MAGLVLALEIQTWRSARLSLQPGFGSRQLDQRPSELTRVGALGARHHAAGLSQGLKGGMAVRKRTT